MDEPAVTSPIQTPAASPSRLPTWVIVVIVFVVLCCCCFGALGLIIAFLGPIKQQLGLAFLLPLAASI
jgi:hypothetical protein